MFKVGEVVVCPNHGGSFDCNPFCVVCEGEQEYTFTGELPCYQCHTRIADDVWREELGMCLECSNKYFDNDEGEN